MDRDSQRSDDNGVNQELLEAALRRLFGGNAAPPPPQPPPPYGGYGGAPPGYGYGYPPPPPGGGGQQSMQQALIWAALGAAAAWVLSDPAVRDKLVKQAIKLYTEMAVGMEEMKEKMADLKAEVDEGLHRGTERGGS